MTLEIVAFGKNGEWYHRRRFQGYSKREAVRLFRQHYGIVGKHIDLHVSRVNLI